MEPRLALRDQIAQAIFIFLLCLILVGAGAVLLVAWTVRAVNRLVP